MAKNPAIKRIHADLRELNREPISSAYSAAPFEDNLFEWHFTLRGPPATPFEGGVYHGRILLPSDYPFKPPNIVFLTPNGRFQVGTKICLSISAHHPEHWQPAWGLRLILEALISFFPTEAAGAIGGLDWTPAERSRLARASLDFRCPKCGLVRDLLPAPQPGQGDRKILGGGGGAEENPYAKQIKELHFHGASDAAAAATSWPRSGDGEGSAAEAFPAGPGADSSNGGSSNGGTSGGGGGGGGSGGSGGGGVAGDEQEPLLAAAAGRTGATAAAAPAATTGQRASPQAGNAAGGGGTAEAAAAAEGGEEPNDLDALMYLAVALAAAIVAIVMRRVLRYLQASQDEDAMDFDTHTGDKTY